MNLNGLRAMTALALAWPLVAFAGPAVHVEIYDRTAGCLLPFYWHDGARHVAGEPGHEYEIRVRNRGRERVLAVTSVDGVNVITGHTASPDQGGYVLDPGSRVEIEGWRKSLAEVAAFYFTALPDSYAARTGRPDNVGVIGLALFRETHVDPEPRASESVASPADEPAPARKSANADSGYARDDSRLGTGHGQRLDSGAVYTRFERASDQPDEIIRIYYDSYRNLVARGVIPNPDDRYARRLPQPFPQAFVPDP